MEEVSIKTKAPPPEGTWTRASLPRPFSEDPWRQEKAEAAAAFWDWHVRLGAGEDDLDEVRDRALKYCAVFELDEQDVLMQIPASERLAGGLRLQDTDEFNEFVHQWTGAHTRLLCGLAGIGGYSWHQSMIDALAGAFFLTGALMSLPDDLERDVVAFPLSELEKSRVTVEELKAGEVTDAVRRLLWRMTVRARDNYANAVNLVDEGSRREAASFRTWWFSGAEMLNVIEKNGFDVWGKPPHLGRYRRLLVRFQARFGNFTFK